MIEITLKENYLKEIIAEKFFNPNNGLYVNPKRIKINIIEDEKKYKRTNILPDNSFCQWLDEEELDNPPSWAIFFGLVAKNIESKYSIHQHIRATINTGNEIISYDRK